MWCLPFPYTHISAHTRICIHKHKHTCTGEGAHATFAPRGWKQRALSNFAEAKLGGHVEVEDVSIYGACLMVLQQIVHR